MTSGVVYHSDQSLGVELDPFEIDAVVEVLAKGRKSLDKARNDAQVFVFVHALRERNNEMSSGGIFGYSTMVALD